MNAFQDFLKIGRRLGASLLATGLLIGCGGGTSSTEVRPVPADARGLAAEEDAAVQAAESRL